MNLYQLRIYKNKKHFANVPEAAINAGITGVGKLPQPDMNNGVGNGSKLHLTGEKYDGLTEPNSLSFIKKV